MAAGKKTGGRSKGTPNKQTAETRALFAKYAKEAPAELRKLAKECENPSVRLAAWKELSDRAWGKPTQSHEGNLGIVQKTHEQWLEEISNDED